jgi:hypothetical protein
VDVGKEQGAEPIAPRSPDTEAEFELLLLPEFGGMGVGAADFIRFLMRKLTLDRIRVPFAAFVQQR